MQQAQARVLEHAQPLPAENVALGAVVGRVTAQEARAAVDLPPFPSSAMDGYAVQAADLPGRLPVVGQVAAGRPAERPLGAGEAMAISTGGVVPEGADAVIPIEYVVRHDNEIETA
jgi:molybdopterin molybdotransferase